MSKEILINHSIPRTMTNEGLGFLGRLAQTVPENGVIVEIGPLYGSATWVLARNASPSAKIFAIDTWEPQPWIQKRYPDAPPLSADAFKEYLNNFSNILPIEGHASDVATDWQHKIDLICFDAVHGDDDFVEHVQAFLPMMAETGIICGDRFAPGCPRIVREINRIARQWEARPEVSGRLWSLMCHGQSTVADHIGEWDQNDLTVVLGDEEGTVYNGSPHMWVGPIHQNKVVSSILVEKKTTRSEIDGILQVRLMDGSESNWISFGELTEFDQPLVNLRVIITNCATTQTDIEYQLCELDPETLNTRNTKVAKNGEWIKKGNDSVVCGVRVVVKSAALNDSAENLQGLRSKIAI